MEFDFETGLQFNRMRYYLPNLGRFIKKDLIFSFSNYYNYANNSPSVNYDPFGYFDISTALRLLGFCIPRNFLMNPCTRSASYIGCLGFCAAMGAYFSFLCGDELDNCIDECSPNDSDCIEHCHEQFFWCLIAAHLLECECQMMCYDYICGGDEEIPGGLPDIY